MFRWVSSATVLAFLLLAQPPHAAQAAGASHAPGKKCDQPKKKSLFGSIAGSIASSALGRAGVGNSVGGVWLPVNSLISEGISKLLDCKEQQQAAHATEEAVRGGVGTTSTWQSESRTGVSGSSTVVAAAPVAENGAQCLTVTDIVIVNGEETRAPKQMCRTPPSNRFVRV
jgi:surface antigen